MRAHLPHACVLLLLAAPTPAQRAAVEQEPAPQAAETVVFPVHLRTEYGQQGAARPAAGIHVMFGVESEGKETADALPLYLDEPILASGTSDAAGSIAAEITLPLDRAGRIGWIWARVETPGHTRRAVRLVPNRFPKEERLMVLRGGTVLGRATTAEGSPLEGASVWLFAGNGASHPSVSHTLASGRFAVDFFRTGRHELHVRSPGHGSSPQRVLELDLERPAEPQDLVLHGGASLTGQVVDSNGEPVPGTWITAVPEGHEPFPSPNGCAAAEREGGLFGGRVQADAQGRFELPALLAGEYRFHAGRVPGDAHGAFFVPEDFGPEIGRATIGAEREPLQLRVPGHRLEVRVTDSGVPAKVVTLDENGEVRSSILSVRHMVDGRAAEGVEWRTFVPIGDLIVVPVETEQEFVLSVEQPGVFVERRVAVERGRERVPVHLELGPRLPPARVNVRVLDPSGLELFCFVTISSAETGVLVSNTLGGDLELPAGRFRIAARTDVLLVGADECLSVLPDQRATHLPAEAIVELRAGGQHDVELRLGAAGNLDFESLGFSAGPDSEDLSWRDGETSEECIRRVSRALGGGPVFLVSKDRKVCIERFTSGKERLDWLAPGWPAQALDALPPGDWTLRVEGEQGTLFEKPVRIEAGRTTVVRW